MIKKAVFVSLILPLINVFIFRGLGIFFLTEPMKYPAVLADTLEFIYDFLTVVMAFLPPLCITFSVLMRKDTVGVSLIAVFSIPVVYAVMILEDALINQKTVDSKAIASTAIDWLTVLIGYVLVVVAAVIVKRESKKAPPEAELFSVHGLLSRGTVASMLVITAFAGIQLAAETCVLVKTYGTSAGFSDVAELAAPYITLLIGAFLSYVIGCLLIMREDLHKNREHRK